MPEPVVALRAAAAEADAALVVTPEYNGSIPGVLKNAIDWLSRPFGNSALKDKPLAVVGAAVGQYGGVWAHDETRKSFGIAGPRVVEDLKLSVQTTAFDGKHPSENAEVAANLRDIVEARGRGRLRSRLGVLPSGPLCGNSFCRRLGRSDLAAATSLRTATKRYRAGLPAAAVRLADFGALKPDMSIDDATDVLWFYFGYSGFFTLMDDNALVRRSRRRVAAGDGGDRRSRLAQGAGSGSLRATKLPTPACGICGPTWSSVSPERCRRLPR